MRTALIAIIAAVVIGFGVLWAAYVDGWFEYTRCFTGFRSFEDATAAAVTGRGAGYEVDVERFGARAHESNSIGGRQVSVEFSDGETGDDAATFRATVIRIVKQFDGHGGHDAACQEEPLLSQN